MIGFLLYSHSSYSDCWPAFLGNMEKFLNPYFTFDEYAILVDKLEEPIPNFKEINYDDNLSYTKRLHQCISQVESEYILISHEDMMLYDHINQEYFEEAVSAIQEDPTIDSIKLIKVENMYFEEYYKDSKALRVTPWNANMKFAIQPTLWKKESYLKLLNLHDANIWDFEVKGQATFRNLMFNSLFTYDVNIDKKRGKYHYDSCTYPYIATAIFKGKWTTNEYPKELECMFNEYNIDKNIRGECK